SNASTFFHAPLDRCATTHYSGDKTSTQPLVPKEDTMTATTTTKTIRGLVAVAAVLTLALTACGTTTESGTTASDTSTQSAPEVDKAAQRDELTTSLDSWFDGCDWETTDSEHTARASCTENELGVIVGNTDTDVKVVLDGIAEAADGGPGGYAVKDN